MGILNELEKNVLNNSESKYFYEIEQQVNEISKVLRQIRINENITQIHIAKNTGLSKQMVSKIECYNGNPTLTTLVKYCDCIGVNLLELLKTYLNDTK